MSTNLYVPADGICAWCFQCAEMQSVAFLLLFSWQHSDNLLASCPSLELFLSIFVFEQLDYSED